MPIIQEYKRDDSKDYLFVLKSLNEIPFPVGKNLLIEFLLGKYEHSSIEKNKLYELNNFGCLNFLEKEKILEIIENLILNGMIDVSGSVFNKFAKVLSISVRGKNELVKPNLNSKKISEKYNEIETKITDKEMEVFKELNTFLGGYNLEQKKAIINPKQKILCIAGAGSGKTTVLTKRIEFLNKMKRIKGEKILAITFTRKAKEEMQKRLEKLKIKTIVETFNSFCEKILLRNGEKIYGKRMKVANYQDRMFAILKALDYQGLNIEEAVEKYFNSNQKRNKTTYQLQNMFVNDCFSVFEYFKTTGKTFDKFNFEKDYSNSKMVFEIVKFLDKYMINSGLRTYADQVNDVLNFFRMYPKKIPEFEHILVDEFQDVNSNQVELLDLLNPKNLFCVGDPRQSIFGWRGSDVNYILNFKNKYSDAEIINLKKNYRSNKYLVEFMNESIKSMKMPDLEHNFKGKNEIKLYNFSSEEEEFGFVLNELMNTEIPFEEIFILARTNKQLSDFAEILKKKRIKYILKNEGERDKEIKKGHVTLSTIHAIKGLEAELVFLIGCNSNNFPCKSSDHPVIENLKMYEYDKEEEERRLFYVAISRAKNKLYLSYAGKKHTYFINERMKEIID